MQAIRSMFGVVFLFFFFLTSNQSLAQSSKNPKESGKNDSAENKLRISISVPAPAKGELKREQFKITEDGFPQAIASLEKPNQSVGYGLIIDTSGSMQFRLPELELLARSLINQLSDKDEMALATSKSKDGLLCGLGSNKDSLTDCLRNLYAGGDDVSLFDGIVGVADYLKETSKKDRRVIIALTDGGERRSINAMDKVASILSEKNISLFIIQIKGPDPRYQDALFRYSKKTEEQLDFLAKISGGFLLAYAPPAKITRAEIDQLIKPASNFTLPIFERSKATYAVSYFSTNNKFDGRKRNAQLQWQDIEGKMNTQKFSYVVPKK